MFLVLMMVNLTPTFAIQMEQVANEAQNYNEQSKNEMGFFKKIRFMVKGFSLVEKVNNAEKSSKTPETEDKSNIDISLFKKTMLTEIQKRNLLYYRNNANNTLNIQKHAITLKNTSKNSYTTKVVQMNDTNQTVNGGLNLPDECYSDVKNVINMLLQSGFTVSQEMHHEIGTSLQGTIVQLIDGKGNIRYAYVKQFDLKTGKLTLQTDENKELRMDLDEFKKEFKGLSIKIGPNDDSEKIMGKIILIQKDNLESEKTNAETSREAAKNGMILWGVLLSVGIVLMVIGIIIAVYFRKELAAQTERLANTATTGYKIGFQNADLYEQIMYDTNKCIGRISSTPDQVINGAYRALQNSMAESSTTDAITGLTAAGFLVVALSTAEIISNTITQNWIKLVLCIIG